MENIKKKFKNFIKNFNSSIKVPLLKNQNKKIITLVKNFNFLIKKTLLKHRNKTNNIFTIKFKFKISNFNKYLISLIGLLFVYLFYLSIPTLYNKTWVQNTLEEKLVNEFKINFSVSSEISYEILPSPHFTIKNAKIFDNNISNPKQLSEIKKLKVFISQKNLFYKKNLKIKKVLINNANFSIQKSDFKFLSTFIDKKISEKKINIKNSNIFFKDDKNETVLITRISKSSLFFDKKNLLNKIILDGTLFKMPFIFTYNKNFNDRKDYFSLTSRKLKLEILNESLNENEVINGLNKILILNSQLITPYKSEENIIIFQSQKSTLNNSKIKYNGKLLFNPFDLILNLNVKKISLKKLVDSQSYFFELLKSKLLFNENISANISFNSDNITNDKLFDSLNLILNLKEGIINFDQTELANKKIGVLKLTNSSLFFHKDDLLFNGYFNIDIKDLKKFYNHFQVPKRLRKPMKNIIFNLEYDILNNRLTLNNFKIDNLEPNPEIKNAINNFNNKDLPQIKNFIEFKNFVNLMFSSYYDG